MMRHLYRNYSRYSSHTRVYSAPTPKSMELSIVSPKSPGATLLGSVPALVLPVRTVKLTRGTGPTLHTYWTGYWTLTP
jgi:hypothetical protein